MPYDPTAKYEIELQKAIVAAEKQIRKIYEQSILKISVGASITSLKDAPFSLSLYPLLNKQIEQQVEKMYRDIYNTVVNSVTNSWNLSNEKNDVIVDRRFADADPSKKAKQILYDPNLEALKEFLTRKENGLNLSQRVWNSLDPFKKEMEQALGLGISKGQSASTLATQLKQYLNEPDKLFRRVRTDEGKLVLSKAAQNYRPGQGVYRSSFKNSLRLTRTETNIAYRSADFTRWQTMPFVVGVEIKLSRSHKFRIVNGKKVCEICESLKGKYPKDFVFTGWHPSCMCYATPVLISNEEYSQYEDQLLSGKQPEINSDSSVEEPPKDFTQWVSDNKERIASWNNKPYWVKDNPQYVSGVEEQVAPTKPTQVTKSVIKEISKDEVYKSELAWAQKAIDRWRKNDAADSWDLSAVDKLSDEEAKVIYAYTAAGYKQLNQQLYSQTENTATLAYEKALNAALEKMPTFEGEVVRQYIPDENQPTAIELLSLYKNNIGGVVEFDGFLSSSRNLTHWEGDAQISYHIQSKTGRMIDTMTAHNDEEEVLFQSKTAFKIVKVSGKDVYLEELD